MTSTHSQHPPKDAAFSNLASDKTFRSDVIGAGRVNSALMVAGELISDSNLMLNIRADNIAVGNLAVTSSQSPINPKYVILPKLGAVLSPGVTYNAAPPSNITVPVVGSISWTTYVPPGIPTIKCNIDPTSWLLFEYVAVTMTGTNYNNTSTQISGPGVFSHTFPAWEGGQMTINIFTNGFLGVVVFYDDPVIIIQ